MVAASVAFVPRWGQSAGRTWRAGEQIAVGTPGNGRPYRDLLPGGGGTRPGRDLHRCRGLADHLRLACTPRALDRQLAADQPVPGRQSPLRQPADDRTGGSLVRRAPCPSVSRSAVRIAVEQSEFSVGVSRRPLAWISCSRRPALRPSMSSAATSITRRLRRGVDQIVRYWIGAPSRLCTRRSILSSADLTSTSSDYATIGSASAPLITCTTRPSRSALPATSR